MAEELWAEAEHELDKRLAAIGRKGRLSSEQARALDADVHSLVDDRVIEVIPRSLYEHPEEIARRRVPRDPDDWAPVALALALDVGILTAAQDFLGCGCPTGTMDTIREGLGSG